MKIAFVSANREKLPDPVVPIGILYVMANTPEHHEKQLWDLCFERDPVLAFKNNLEAFQPDVVAIGMRNLYNSDYSGVNNNVQYYKSLVDMVRQRSKAKVVLGGGGFSVIPEKFMNHLRPDFGIAGEGEEGFSKLIHLLETGSNEFEKVPGLYYFKEATLQSNPAYVGFLDLNGLNQLPRKLVNKNYYKKVGIENIQTKRGCVLKCSYCSYPKIEGKKYRTRDPKKVVDELFISLEMNPEINHFFIVDSVFNLPKAHAKEICREMIARKFSKAWTCYINPLGFDDELADLMKESGCIGMEIGSDSGCDEVLKELKKGFTTQDIRRVHEISKRAGLADCHSFILGTQNETMEQVHRTIDFIVDMDPFAAIVMAWTDDEDALGSENAKIRQIFRDQIIDELRVMRNRFPRWIIPPLGSNFDYQEFRYLRLNGFEGPLWQHIRTIREMQVQPLYANNQN